MLKKSGFTLIELMAVLGIFSIFTVLLGGVYIQSNKINAMTKENNDIQNLYRTTLMSIEQSLNRESQVYVYKTNKLCTLSKEAESQSYDVKPLLGIESTIDINELTVIYGLVANDSGSFNLEKITVSSLNNPESFRREDIDAKSFNIIPTSREILLYDVVREDFKFSKSDTDLTDKKLNIKMNIKSGIGQEREYETSISLDNDTSTNINVNTTIENSDVNILTGIFGQLNPGNNTGQGNPFYIRGDYNFGGNVAFIDVVNDKLHNENCNHSIKEQINSSAEIKNLLKYNVIYESVSKLSKKEKFICGQGGNIKSIATNWSVTQSFNCNADNTVVFSEDNIEAKVLSGKYQKTMEGNITTIVSNGNIEIYNKKSEKELSETLVIITTGTVEFKDIKDSTNNFKSNGFKGNKIAIVADKIVARWDEDMDNSLTLNFALLYAKSKLNLNVDYFEILSPLNNYLKILEIVKSQIGGELISK